MRNLGPASIVVLALLLAVSLLAYVGGYLLLPWETHSFAYPPEEPFQIERIYAHPWQETIFAPAAWVEGALRGHEVTTAWAPPPSPE
jgi:hypothetical protein